MHMRKKMPIFCQNVMKKWKFLKCIFFWVERFEKFQNKIPKTDIPCQSTSASSTPMKEKYHRGSLGGNSWAYPPRPDFSTNISSSAKFFNLAEVLRQGMNFEKIFELFFEKFSKIFSKNFFWKIFENIFRKFFLKFFRIFFQKFYLSIVLSMYYPLGHESCCVL